MQTKLVVMPRDSMWWIVRPEFVAFLDKIVMDKSHFAFEENEKDRSGFHRLAWDRLNVLGDTGLLELRDLGISDTDVKCKADRLLSLIQSNEEWMEQFCSDLAFGYQYWIDFNQMKIDLLPDNEEYSRLIQENMGIWLADLQALQQRGKLALEERPAILKHVGQNVLEKVVTLDLLARKHGLCPLSALKEYEPFVKWLYAEFDNPLATERTALTYKGKIPQRTNAPAAVDLPVEPEYDFLRFALTKKSFLEKLKDILSLYEVFRKKTRHLFEASQNLVYGLSLAKLPKRVTSEFVKVNWELRDLSSSHMKRSRYLSNAFSGISLVPIPWLSTFISSLSLAADQISSFIAAFQLYSKNFRPTGLSAYYSFLESLVDTSYVPDFPAVVDANRGWRSPVSGAPFWRLSD